MHRQLGGDLIIGEVVEQLQLGRPQAIDEDGALAAKLGQEALAGIATILIVGGAPDMLEAFGPRHGLHRPGFALDDGVAHVDRRAGLSQIAIGVEVARPAVGAQRVEHAGDALGEELAHREHLAAHPERR